MGLGRWALWAIALGSGIAEASAPEEAGAPALAILLDDGAGLPPATLRKTEAAAANVFRQAGVAVRWINCSLSQAELRDPPGCQLSLDLPTVVAKILPEAESRRWGGPADRLGFCLDKDIYLLIPGIQAVADRQGLPIWLVLGHALVHEAGHALLGPGHSQRVMQRQLGKTHWRQGEKGQLFFAAHDAKRIRQTLVRLMGQMKRGYHPAEQAVTARAPAP